MLHKRAQDSNDRPPANCLAPSQSAVSVCLAVLALCHSLAFHLMKPILSLASSLPVCVLK